SAGEAPRRGWWNRRSQRPTRRAAPAAAAGAYYSERGVRSCRSNLQVDHSPDPDEVGEVERNEGNDPRDEIGVVSNVEEKACVEHEQQCEGEDRQDGQHHRGNPSLARQGP